MDVTLFQMIGQMIGSIGLANTMIALAITIGLGLVYRNERKQKKVLAETVSEQNSSILKAIDSQNTMLYEIQRLSVSLGEILSEVSGKLDATVGIITELMRRDIGGRDEGGK